jgi:large subunit ribosomal protein L35
VPKLKTHKGAKSRFYITGKGKIMRTKGGKTHFRRNRSKTARRLYDNKLEVDKVNVKQIKRLLPGV